MQISLLGGWLVSAPSALSMPIGEKGTISLLTLTLTTVTSIQLQSKQAFKPLYVHTSMQGRSKITSWKMYSSPIPICEIKNKKEWHWTPNICILLRKKFGAVLYRLDQHSSASDLVIIPMTFHPRKCTSKTKYLHFLSYLIQYDMFYQVLH
jgi:hypothetical protein